MPWLVGGVGVGFFLTFIYSLARISGTSQAPSRGPFVIVDNTRKHQMRG